MDTVFLLFYEQVQHELFSNQKEIFPPLDKKLSIVVCKLNSHTTSSLTFFDICKNIGNLLFWKLWKCLIIPIKIIVSICRNFPYLFICMQKVNFITHFFLKILERNSRPVILGNLSMSGHTNLK